MLELIQRTFMERYGERLAEFTIPPPSFRLMQGEFVSFDPVRAVLSARFPVLEDYLNTYHTMQGGMIAAALDNVLGPLGMLIAPPNVTRRLEITYSKPVTLEMGFILVSARLVEREGNWLRFKAEVCDRQGQRLARAKASHWIYANSPSA